MFRYKRGRVSVTINMALEIQLSESEALRRARFFIPLDSEGEGKAEHKESNEKSVPRREKKMSVKDIPSEPVASSSSSPQADGTIVKKNQSTYRALSKRLNDKLMNPSVATTENWTSDESSLEDTPPSKLPRQQLPTKFRHKESLVLVPKMSPNIKRNRYIGERKRATKFRVVDIENLVVAVNRYGEGFWNTILDHYDFPPYISNVNLKDKWRNLKIHNHVKLINGKWKLLK